MKNIIFVMLSLFVSVGVIYADVPTVDIIEIEFEGNTYFTYSVEFADYFDRDTISKDAYKYIGFEIVSDSIILYKKWSKIGISKFGNNGTIHILQNDVRVRKSDLIGNFMIKKITRGHSSGLIYSSGLNESDNTWINDYEIEMIFDLSDNEMCNMEFYTIKGNLDKEEKNALRKDLQKLIMTNRDEFDEKIKELYLQNIIMIGFCSC